MNIKNLKAIKWGLSDILEYYPNWSELTPNELIELIFREFRNSENWFFEITKKFSKNTVAFLVKKYIGA